MTIISRIRSHFENTPNRVVLKWFDDKGKQANSRTYRELWKKSGSIAAELGKQGIQKGERVMLVFPFGLEFMDGLIGCMRAGVIKVSVYPPNPEKLDIDIPKFEHFVRDSGSKVVITTLSYYIATCIKSPLGRGKWPELKWIKGDRSKGEYTEEIEEEIAFIQYTSGSTGDPKGVVVKHQNLERHLDLLAVGIGGSSDLIGVTWLPQYHDYGLICNYLLVIYVGGTWACMSPLSFIKKPLLWVDLLERERATHTAAPNFAWGLLHKRLDGKTFNGSTLTHVDISAEPIDPRTLDQMVEIGVPKDAISGTYGMAESIALLFCKGTGFVDGFASCGQINDSENKIHIVKGKIFVQGNALASGYWNKPKLTAETFQNVLEGEEGMWLDTGDLGFVHDGQLYVQGREKEASEGVYT